MNKTILVIGCTGQDGSYLCKSLLKKGFHVIGVSSSNSPNVTNHKKLGIESDVQIIHSDLTNFNEAKKLIIKFCPDEIYNLSAQSSVGLSFKEPLDTFRSIVDPTRNILENARLLEFKGRIFFAGSGEIYGESEKAACCDTTKRPVSPYGCAKLESLIISDLYRKL